MLIKSLKICFIIFSFINQPFLIKKSFHAFTYNQNVENTPKKNKEYDKIFPDRMEGRARESQN